MIKCVRLALVVSCVGVASQGCGPLEDGDVASDVETTQSALGNFGATWSELTGRVVGDGPALAFGPTLTAFGLGRVDRQIYVTNQNSAGNWNGSWVGIPIANDSFSTRPSATGFFGVTTGGLAGKLAVVAMANSDRHYWLTIRDQTGTVVEQNWIQVPNGTFSSAPGIAFVKPFAAVGPSQTLVLVGRGDDSKIWFATNTLRVPPGGSGLAYENNRWTGFNPINTKTFAGPPAITYGHSRGGSEPVIVVAARDFDGTFWSTTSSNGTSWTAWTQVPNGTFFEGPALGTGLSGNGQPEISIYGRGMDNRVWKTVLVGATGFSPIGNDTMVGCPQAAGRQETASTGRVFVSVIRSGGPAFSNSALSPGQ